MYEKNTNKMLFSTACFIDYFIRLFSHVKSGPNCRHRATRKDIGVEHKETQEQVLTTKEHKKLTNQKAAGDRGKNKQKSQ